MDDQNTSSAPQSAQPAAAGQSGQPATGTPGAAGQNLSGIMEENVDISSLIASAGNQQTQQQFLSSVKIPPHPNTTFDEKLFIELLAGSISLTINEKKNIITAVPQLSQFQIDELIKIFQEEKGKFAELEKKHAGEIAELEKMHSQSWQDLESKAEEETQKSEEQVKADAIRKSLGI